MKLRLIALGASIVLASCDGTGSSTTAPTPPTVVNQPPAAVITVSASSVQERQSFTLSGSSSSDPEGRDLTFNWTQTAGTLVAIDDPSQVDLSLLMPEVLANETLQFALDASDGNQTTRATVNIVLENIVLSPENTDFSLKVTELSPQIVSSKSLNIVSTAPVSDALCQTGDASTTRLQIHGQDMSGQTAVGVFNTSETTLDVSSFPEASNSLETFFAQVFYLDERPCPNDAARVQRNLKTETILHFTESGNLFQVGQSQKIDQQNEICAAETIPFARKSSRESVREIGTEYVTARTNGGLDIRTVSLNNQGVLTFGEPKLIVSEGNFCNLDIRGERGTFTRSGEVYRTNVFAVDVDAKELLSLRHGFGYADDPELTEGVLIPLGDKEAYVADAPVSLPDLGELNIIDTAFLSETVTSTDATSVAVAVLASDGTHTGTHRLLVYRNKATRVLVTSSEIQYSGYELMADLEFSGGIPNNVSLTPHAAIVTLESAPYALHFSCDFIEGVPLCDENGLSYIETGFGVGGLAVLQPSADEERLYLLNDEEDKLLEYSR